MAEGRLRGLLLAQGRIASSHKKYKVQWDHVWVSEWVNEWVGGWMSECVSRWVSEWMRGWVSVWVSDTKKKQSRTPQLDTPTVRGTDHVRRRRKTEERRAQGRHGTSGQLAGADISLVTGLCSFILSSNILSCCGSFDSAWMVLVFCQNYLISTLRSPLLFHFP